MGEDGARPVSEENVADEVAPGIFVIRFKPGRLDGAHAEALGPALLAASAKGPLVLLADLPPGTTIVPPSWLCVGTVSRITRLSASITPLMLPPCARSNTG